MVEESKEVKIMTLVLRNSLSRKIEEFKPLKKGKVMIYTCGPTVYGTPHIGNYRTFFMSDMMRRYFEFKEYEVFHLMNITDIDDKTIRDSGKEGLGLKEFTDKHIEEFFQGIDWLHMKRAHLYPRATEHIPAMIELVKKLEKKGYAYNSEDGVYFDIRKFKDYGKLANVDLEAQLVGDKAKTDDYDKAK
ncbi:MAG: class I tRNA ligase family protein [Candidatus Heimdallarchaeota archaeon]